MHAEIASNIGETSATCPRQAKVANGVGDFHAAYVKNSPMYE